MNVTTHAQIEVQAGEDPVDHDLHDLDLDNLDEVDEEDLVLEADIDTLTHALIMSLADFMIRSNTSRYVHLEFFCCQGPSKSVFDHSCHAGFLPESSFCTNYLHPTNWIINLSKLFSRF